MRSLLVAFTLVVATHAVADDAPRVELRCYGYEYGNTLLSLANGKLRVSHTPWASKNKPDQQDVDLAADDETKLQTLVETFLTDFRDTKFADNRCEDCLRYEIRLIAAGRVREMRMHTGQVRDPKMKSRVQELLRTANELTPTRPFAKAISE